MNHIHLLVCLLVAGGAWAKCDDDCDLNLGSIFRTPKDFSRTNFDHFEILERNNFENQDLPITNEVITTEQQPCRSVANAQVMLRFGGDSINDCNCAPRTCDLPAQLPLVLNEPRYARYPYYLPAPSLRSYPAPPPLAFPGCYYTPVSLPAYPVSPCSSCSGRFVPSAVQIESTPGYLAMDNISEESDEALDTVRVEIGTPWGSQDYPTIVESNEFIDDRSVDGAWSTAPLRESRLINNRPNAAEEIVVENDSTEFPLLAVIPTAETVTVNRVIVDSEPCPKKVSYVEVNLADARPCENLDLPTRSIDTLLDQALIPFSCQKCCQKKRVLVSYPICNDEMTILNNPAEEIVVSGCSSCQNYEPCGCCNRQRDATIPYGKRFAKDLDSLFEVTTCNAPVSYIPSNLYKSKFEELPVTMWSPLSILSSKFSSPNLISSTSSPCSTGCSASPRRCSSTPICSTTIAANPPCNSCAPKCSTKFIELKRDIPCSKPVVEVVKTVRPCADSCSTLPTSTEIIRVAPNTCGGSSRYASELFTGLGSRGLEKPKLYLDGCKRGCDARPAYETVIYKKPTFWDLVKIPNTITPVIERVEPIAYNAFPKYDRIIEEDIAQWDGPELVSANKYDFNTVISQPIVAQTEIVQAEPFLGSGPYAPDWSYSTGATLVRDAPLYTNYIRRPGCGGRYLGEINELDIKV